MKKCWLLLSFVCFSLSLSAQNSFKIKKWDAETLVEAFENLEDGQTLTIPEGTYQIENGVEIKEKKDVTVIGQGKVTIVVEESYANVLQVYDSKNIHLENLHLTHIEPVPGSQCSGSVLYLNGVSDVVVKNCDLNGCGQIGVYGFDLKNIKLEGNHIHNNSVSAISIYNNEDEGAWVLNNEPIPDWITASGNMIENNGSPEDRVEFVKSQYDYLEWDEYEAFLKKHSQKVKKVDKVYAGDSLKIHSKGELTGVFLGVEWGDFAHFNMGVEGIMVDFLVGPADNFEEFEERTDWIGRNVRVKWRYMDMDMREFSGMIEPGFQLTEIELLND